MATAVIETKGRIKEVHIEGLVSLHFSLFIFIVVSVSVHYHIMDLCRLGYIIIPENRPYYKLNK